MVRKRVLVIGGSFSAVPILGALKALDYELLLLTGNTMEPGIQYADEVYITDYSKIAESIEMLRNVKFDAVVPSCNDSAYLLASELADRRNLFGYDTLAVRKIINQKKDFRKYCDSNEISVPQTIKIDEVNEKVLPLIIKPNIAHSGRGITIVRETKELLQAVSRAKENSLDGECTLERYLEGTLHSVSIFILEGEIHRKFFADEFCTEYPFQVNNSNSPSTLHIEILQEVESEVYKLIQGLKLVDGLVHVQFIVENGSVYLIEMMRRSPGDLFGLLIQYSTEFEYYKAYLAGFLNEIRLLDSEMKASPDITARFTNSSLDSWTVDYFEIPAGIYRLYVLEKTGTVIPAAPYGKVSIGFCKFDSWHDLHSVAPNFNLRVITNRNRVKKHAKKN